MAAKPKASSSQNSLLSLVRALRLQVQGILEASEKLNRRSKDWKPEEREELARLREASEKLNHLLGPPVSCPRCQKQLAYLPQHRKRQVRCTPCGHQFRLDYDVSAKTAAVPASTPIPAAPSRRGPRRLAVAAAVALLLGLSGFAAASWFGVAGLAWPLGGNSVPDYPLKDEIEANRTVTEDLLDLAFVDSQGRPVKLGDYRGRRNLVLVVMRGYSGSICPVCRSQTSRLINNYAEFTRREAEVILAFPGQKNHLSLFLAAAKVGDASSCPFPVLLDEDAKAVDQLGIRGNLAMPSTYILDREGKVRFAYVGATVTDRPSVKAMLTQLDRLAEPSPPK